MSYSKIIGFTISLSPISHKDIDIFNAGLTQIKKKYGDFFNLFLGNWRS